MAVFVFGSNAVSQLGLGEDGESTHVPTKLGFFDGILITKVRCGSMHALALSAEGVLYSWGCNDEGALGRDGDESVPAEIVLNGKAVDMDCGVSISVALTENGHVYIWGTFRTSNGVFGLTPSKKISFKPVRVALKNIKSVYAGHGFVAAIDSKGIVFTFGSNQFGVLGRRTSERNKVRALMPDAVTNIRSRLKNYRFSSIGCGMNHLIALNTCGEAYCWGSNVYGQLGHYEAESTIKKHKVGLDGISQVCGGGYHSLFTTESGDIYGCGRNIESQLGIPKIEDSHTLVKIGLKDVRKVRSYSDFSICLVGNDLYSWGMGFGGVLGFDEEVVTMPRKIPFEFPEVVDFDVGNDFCVVIVN
ncbi:hypothetical protein HK407_04g06470 [Ordospora pajunii]|uniref:uncharacterized protein n=1 Tax=Ordospora pajunii TaxID=3039483 RepID=UPI00295260DB|nr:uncharacterized protein HK407_04g06470 [Ordospora pajunii]KAH9411545.1 hypothetical protein HK407_04g06470 [Ordospora pajunii]